MLQWPPILAKVQPHQRVQVTKRGSGIFKSNEARVVPECTISLPIHALHLLMLDHAVDQRVDRIILQKSRQDHITLKVDRIISQKSRQDHITEESTGSYYIESQQDHITESRQDHITESRRQDHITEGVSDDELGMMTARQSAISSCCHHEGVLAAEIQDATTKESYIKFILTALSSAFVCSLSDITTKIVDIATVVIVMHGDIRGSSLGMTTTLSDNEMNLGTRTPLKYFRVGHDTENRNVDAIDKKGGRNGTFFQKTRMKSTKPHNSNFPKNHQGWSSNEKRKCFRCGYYQGHSKEQCPAKDAICNKCRKKGHFAKVCNTKTIQEVSSSQNNAFIGIVGKQENAEDKWCEVIKVNDQPIKFKIDTRAEVSVMPEEIYLQYFGYLKTEKADKNLFAVSKKIEVNGMFQAFLESKRQKCEESIYIVKGVARPLLSCRASEILGLVRRINIVEDHAPTKLDPMLKFPGLFTGLGKIDIPYKIKEIHPIPVVEHTLAQLKGAKLFTKLDCNSGFWQIQLSSESSALTTFITPFGRFRFKRLPFGISSAPEILKKIMGQILEGLEGTLCHMDDILVYGSCQEEHDKRLETVLTRLSKSGLTLNKDKCKFAVTTIKFLGHQIDPNGIQVDPRRKRAILEFPKPRSVKKEEWIWEDDQDRAFNQIKKSLTSAQGLALYDPSLPITVSADASSFGLGAVIWQTKDGLRQVIAYASRTLSETEKRYAQIEKEALAITWACEKFKQYIQGLRLSLRIMRYSYKIVHTPGKNLIVADALSRSPRMKVGTQELEEELCAYVQQVVSFMPISDVRVKEIKESQDKDQIRYPREYQEWLLQRIHEGHLGIVKCRERAKGSVWWPRITSEIEEIVRTCPMCIEVRTNRHQPLLPSELPSCPWEKVGVDLFTIKGQNYLLITDYYSRYPGIARLEDMTSASVMVHCKSIFARHGIPLEVRSDNGPQIGSLFKGFAQDYGFTHVTSSPRYPQSNGFIEYFVKIVKERIGKSKDPYLALLAYRATPLANGFSPAELSMGRRIRTTIPTPTKQHQPPNLKNLKNQEAIQREKQKYFFGRAKGVRELPPLDVNDRVWLTDLKTSGVIISKADTPRSYMVDTPRGRVRRNRFHLLPTGQRSPGSSHFEPDEEAHINYPRSQHTHFRCSYGCDRFINIS
ncbi:K02A2.6-like [Cordylochernes scorpioides]|uniref:RNA-directed DNA polymerase n=1 Tax=Cordylochernes scorpioides TaxID=51811 RepID=A0ABY6L2S7_9ARAC|nr:K02A2.6-like [Cordylochernes scorpioides]